MASPLPLHDRVNNRNASPAEHEARIRLEILDYMRGHPHAMDSLEGIATWWLPRHEARVGIDLVARAIEVLQEDGLLERVGDAERPLFRLRPSAVPERAHRSGNPEGWQ